MNFPKPSIIETERFVLKPMNRYVLAYKTYHWTQNSNLFYYLNWRIEGWNIYRWYRHISKRYKPNIHFHAILVKGSGEIIGLRILHLDRLAPNMGQSTTLVGEKHWRKKGVHSEVLKATVDYCFENLNFIKYRGHIAAENEISLKNNLAIGFAREGVLRQEFQLPDGSRTDKVVLGITRDEWLSLRKGQSHEIE